MSSAITRPGRSGSRRSSSWRSHCDQPPGAAPRSTTVMPGFSSRSRATNSSSLYTARERMPSACARLTNGSEKCSLSQRWLLLLRAMGESRSGGGRAGIARGHDNLPILSHCPQPRMPAALTAAQIRFLRGQAHDLKAILQVGGKGLTEPVLAELDGALEHHELVKVRIAAADREARDGIVAELADRS